MKYCPLCTTELTVSEIDMKDRIHCPSDACNFVYWNNPTPVIAAIVEHKGKIIIARGHHFPEGLYGLIAGFLEEGEHPDSAILREVKEELNLEGEIVRFIGYYSFLEKNQLLLVFHVKAEGVLQPNEELAEIKKVSPENLEPWDRGTGPAVRDWILDRFGKEHLETLLTRRVSEIPKD